MDTSDVLVNCMENVGKYSGAAISLWNNFEIILGKFISVGTSTKAEIMLK